MNKKILIILSLLLIGLVFLSNKMNVKKQEPESQSNVSFEQNGSEETKTVKVEKLEIIDFHGTRRCFSCQTIEQFTKETLDEYFKEELENGKITFQSINVEEEANKEIVQKYQATGSSLFLNAIQNGEDNISQDMQVWRLVQDEKGFKQYLKNKIETLLN